MDRIVLRMLVLVLFVSANDMVGQDMLCDTMKIEEVSIIQPRISHFTGTQSIEEVDSLKMVEYANNDLSYLLSKTSLVNISQYGGNGSQASVAIRGGGSNHTSVMWNGIPINSLTTGGADLSMINVGAFEQINIVYGASGSFYGNGTFGGVVELNNVPQFEKKEDYNLYAELSSFSNYRYRVSASISNERVSYKGQVYYLNGKNDFKYIDELDFGAPEETSVHGETMDVGSIHNLTYKINNHQLNLGVWYQIKEHNIPGKMGIGPPVSYQEQKDSTLKTFVGWKTIIGKVKIEAQTAFLSDFLRYTDKEPNSDEWKIFSEIGSKRWLSNLSSRFYVSNGIALDFRLKYNSLKGEVTAYNKDRTEEEFAWSTAGQYKRNRIIFDASLSKEFNSVTSPPYVYHAGVAWFVIPNKIQLKSKYGTHYRRPTFNERYWIPGGNVNLKPEEGGGFESSIQVQEKLSNRSKLSGNVSYYYSFNENMIIWLPEDGYSKPENTNKVVSNGLEFDMTWDKKVSNYWLGITAKYGLNNTYYNDSKLENYKEKLAYKPQHLVKVMCNYGNAQWNVSLNNSFQSAMKSIEGNVMKSFALTDVAGYYNWGFNKLKLTARASIQNVFNHSYQVIYAYPMPGRMYSLGININFK